MQKAYDFIHRSGMISVADYLVQFPVAQHARQSIIAGASGKQKRIGENIRPIPTSNKNSMIEVSGYEKI
jgi:hypothetical protein